MPGINLIKQSSLERLKNGTYPEERGLEKLGYATHPVGRGGFGGGVSTVVLSIESELSEWLSLVLLSRGERKLLFFSTGESAVISGSEFR